MLINTILRSVKETDTLLKQLKMQVMGFLLYYRKYENLPVMYSSVLLIVSLSIETLI